MVTNPLLLYSSLLAFQFLSIGNNIIPPQLLQRTTMVMLVPNLNWSMLLSLYAETMIPTYKIMPPKFPRMHNAKRAVTTGGCGST